MRTVLAVALAAAAIGVAAPSASARCGPDEPYVSCTVKCLRGVIEGYVC